MDLFKLERVLNSIQKKNENWLLNYRPFLGVSHFDNGKNLLFKNAQEVTNWNLNFKTQGKLYFFIANTSTSNLEKGEHWFLVSFETDVRNVLYIYNTFGLVNTLKTFGYSNADSESERLESSFFNITERKKAVLDLSNIIWDRPHSERKVYPKVIDLNGIHQDFSTDECGYYCLKFALFLFKNIIPRHTSIEFHKTNWHACLKSYLYENNIKQISYDSYKLNRKSEAENILLKNDRNAVSFIENYVGLETYKKQGDLIEKHEEFDLSESSWNSIAENYERNYNLFARKVTFKSFGLTCEFDPELLEVQNMNQPKRRRKLKRKTTHKKEKKGERLSNDPLYNKKATKSIKSLSKKLIQELFPDNLVNSYSDPIINDIQYSGMIDNPDYLDSIKLSLPGEECKILSVREYYWSLNIDLDSTDPYTFTLANLTKNFFEFHPLKYKSNVIKAKIQEDNAKQWKGVY